MPVQATLHVAREVDLKQSATDSELWFNQLKAGDNFAFQQLYKKYAASILGCLTREVKDRNLAEQLLKDTFLIAKNRIIDIQESPFSTFTWLHRIARSCLRQHRN